MPPPGTSRRPLPRSRRLRCCVQQGLPAIGPLNIDEIARRRYRRRHDRNTHFRSAPPQPLPGRGGEARLIVTCGRGFRGAFL
jgi:hypothetical protein